MSMNRGSEWRVWDLHFHTPSSYDYKDKSVKNEEIIDGLVAADVSVVAITDHHIIDVHRIKELQKIGKEKGVSVLPGIEFCSELGGTESIHFIGIFSENCDLESIWTKIQGQCNLTDADVKEKGYERICCEFAKTSDLIIKLGGIISVHAGKKSNSLECIKNNLLVKQELKQDLLSRFHPLLDVGKPEDAEAYKNKVFPDIKFSLPIILCSDNHNIKEYQVKERMWIKADTTFEGLKQIIYEPEERVKIQKIRPDEKNIYQVIDEISLVEDEFWNNTICLSQNLNTIIGGRSTGKSTLLKAIAAKHGRNFVSSDDFVNNHLHGVTVKWKDGTEQIGRDIDYFGQSYMHDIAFDANKTNALIENIIRNNDKSENLKNYYANLDEESREISRLIFLLFQKNREKIEKESSLSTLGNKEGVSKQIQILKKKIEDIQKDLNLSQDEFKKFEGQVENIKEYLKEIELADNDLSILEKAKMLTPFDNSFEERWNLTKLSFRLNNYDFLRETKNIRIKGETEFCELVEKYSLATSQEKTKLEQQIADIKNTESYIKGNQYIECNKELKDIRGKLLEEEKKLNCVMKLSEEIQSLNSTCKKLSDDIIEKHCLLKEKTDDIADKIKVNYDGLSINVLCQYLSAELQEFLEIRLNQRGADRQRYTIQFVQNYGTDNKLYASDILKKLLYGKLILKNGYDAQNVAIELLAKSWYKLSYELLYQNDSFSEMSEGKQAFVILKLLLEFSEKKCPILIDQPEDSLDNRAIYNELVEYLKKKKKERQIILVTHNSNVVVSADAENVIVANQEGIGSHNTNRFRFQYINGSLENTKAKVDNEDVILLSQGIREHVCDILEGGKDAFEKREQKYGFKRK